MRLRWRPNLSGKIIAWSFVPTVIILSAVVLATYAAYQDVTETLVMERNQELARLSAIQLATKLGEYGEILAHEARSADLYSGDPQRQRDALERASNRLAIFDEGTVLLDTFGLVLDAQPARGEIAGQNWSDRAYYRQVVRAQAGGSANVVFSDIVADGPGGARVVAVAAPVIGPQGEFGGTLVGMFRTKPDAASALYGAIVRLRMVEGGDAYLVDGGGDVIYHSDAQYIGRNLLGQPPVQQALRGQVGALRVRTASGPQIVASYAPVPSTAWGLVIEESWATLLSRGKEYRPFLLALLVLGVAVPSLVVSFATRRITGPVRELTAAAHQVASGHFQQSISAQTGDEIEDLADSFNTMSEQLQAMYGHLEQRIADRTRELAALNAIAATVSQSLDLDEILDKSLEETLDVIHIETGGIYLLDPGGETLHIAACRGFDAAFVAAIDHLKSGEGFSGRVVETGEPLVVPNVSLDPRLTRLVVREEGLRSLAVVPLNAKGRVLGALFVLTAEYRDFTEEDVQLLASIGNQIGVAVENARFYEQAQQLAVMEERQRLARELHDAVTQTLFSASLLSEALPSIWRESQQEGAEVLEELRRLNRGALAEMRTLLLELRPTVLAEANLGDLLRQLGVAVTGRTGAPVAVRIGDCGPLPAEVHVAFYRIAQEALNNVVKHAQASAVELVLDGVPIDESEKRCCQVGLRVSDNGRGFDMQGVPAERLGLNIMRERARAIGARLSIDSRPGAGTVMTVEWVAPPPASAAT